MKRVTQIKSNQMRQVSKQAEERWTLLLKECSRLKTFNLDEIRKKARVDAKVFVTLRKLNWIVSSSKGHYNWIAPEPLSTKQLSVFFKEHRKTMSLYNDKKNGEAVLSTNKVVFKTLPVITEEEAIECLRRAGGYEIYKVERRSII